MLKLVEEIAASPYAAHLFGRNTSVYATRPDRQGQLNLSRTRTIITRHQMLAVSFVPEDDWFLFEYFEAAYDPSPGRPVVPMTRGSRNWSGCSTDACGGSNGQRPEAGAS